MPEKREGLSIPWALSATGSILHVSQFRDAQEAAQLNRAHNFRCPCCHEHLLVAKDKGGLHFKHDAQNPDNASCALYSGAHRARERRWRSQDAPEPWQKRFPQGIAVAQEWLRNAFDRLFEQHAVDLTQKLRLDPRRLAMNRETFRFLCTTNGSLVKEFVRREHLTKPQRHYPTVKDTAHALRTQLLWRYLIGPARDAQELRNLLLLTAAWRAYKAAADRKAVEHAAVKQLLRALTTGTELDLEAAWREADATTRNRGASLVSMQAAFLIHHFPFIEAFKAQLRQDFGIAVADGARYVYLLVDSDREGWVKVGMAIDPAKRARQLETGSPGRMLVLDAHLYIGGATAEIALRQALRELTGGDMREDWVQLRAMTVDQAIAAFRELAGDQFRLDALQLPKIIDTPPPVTPVDPPPADIFAPIGSRRR